MKAIIEFPEGKEAEFHRMMKDLGAYVGACSEQMYIPRICSIENVRQQVDDFCEDCKADGQSVSIDKYFDKEELANKIFRECVRDGERDKNHPDRDIAQDILIDSFRALGLVFCREMLRVVKRRHPELDMKEASSLAFALPSDTLFRMKDREFLEAVDESTRKLRRVRTPLTPKEKRSLRAKQRERQEPAR